jgi:hypothetical protein
MTPHDICPGESYACKYRDLSGRECLALIVRRDPEVELLIIRDVETGIEFTARYTDVFDIDSVEWRES